MRHFFLIRNFSKSITLYYYCLRFSLHQFISILYHTFSYFLAGQQTTVSLPSCIDQNPQQCDLLGPSVCTYFAEFAKQNCAAKCGLCPDPTAPSGHVTAGLFLAHLAKVHSICGCYP
jgi:hypothetical protein